ncbi:class I SAM-dependent methyltransferase [Streptomyces sp. DG2A-72]|uniref:class I SAM-dependent methyltransferase n=1 Tax=Streptomyces sp. DG2A-72 TaxID=3051386 RepID=UPI00265BC1D3|nr:class I SAM-dependent methyltransferase [Streptomyces sp. DG2A-72]MDO0937728.1 class I SAM-dependent methyltransferase [Streptomyces sp. DG2A-72]
MTERDVRLGTVQETLLIPLYGRAVENRKKEAVLRDAVAEELVAAIDYDFARFDGLPMLLGTVLRTSLFDRWVTDFLAEHPTGTVVEIGTGLNTRYERTDNGQARWFELDLPDVIELRRTFFTDTPRRTMIATSVTDKAWADTVAAQSGGPYLFAAEAVLPYLEEADVRDVIDLLADRFPGSLLALDTSGPGHFDTQDQPGSLGKVDARMQWSCADPARLAEWRPGVDVLASDTFSSLPAPMYDELPAPVQEMVTGLAAQRLPQVEDYRLNLVRLPRGSDGE